MGDPFGVMRLTPLGSELDLNTGLTICSFITVSRIIGMFEDKWDTLSLDAFQMVVGQIRAL